MGKRDNYTGKKAYERDMRKKHIKRKKRLCHAINGWDWYEHDGQYSKGKIRCDCKICKYGRHFGLPTVKDKRESEKERIEIKELYNEM